MAEYSITYKGNGVENHELKYRESVFSYSMIPDELGKTSDDVAFGKQVSEVFNNESEDTIDILNDLSFADEDEIEEILSHLVNNEKMGTQRRR